MVRTNNYQELEFTHFVIAHNDGTIFGSAREDGRIRNFLLAFDGSEVKEQYHGDYWRLLTPEGAEEVKSRAKAAYSRVPIYRTRRFLF